MHHGVLGAADVEVDGQPVVRGFAIEWSFVFMRRGEAQEVPRRTSEAVERVGLAFGRASALWTGCVDELGNIREWGAPGTRGLIFLHLGEPHGQLVFRYRNDAVVFAIDDRNRRAPVTLSRDQPIPHPVTDGRFSYLMLDRIASDRLDGVVGRQTIEDIRIN